ncbi:MAG: hypothetical protein IJC66_06310, partial [Kiritimatiellae bacterium]|nr:hypothetical protein [Kiritimatiellia bacterium]
GGKLVVAGTMHVSASQGDQYAVSIGDLLLLGGSNVRIETYGPFYPRNNVTSVVEVAGTVDNPATISHHYYDSATDGGYVRSHSLLAYFKGAADSALAYTRPFVNYKGTACDYGFFAVAPNYAFAKFPGTLILHGGNTVLKPEDSAAFNWPLTALRVKDGANCSFYARNIYYNAATANAYLRSLDFSGGSILVNAKSSASSFVQYPVINVTERFAGDSGSTFMVNGLSSDMVTGITTNDPSCKFMKVASLTGEAAANPADLGSIKVDNVAGGELGRFFALTCVDKGDSGKDVYLSSPGIVTMTNINVETTSGSSINYGAFEDGHAGDWSNLKTPPKDSNLHYWAHKRLCFFQDTILSNATLTIGVNSSWKGGSNIQFKEINFLQGKSFGFWGGNRNRRLKADRLNIVRINDAATSSALLYGFHDFTLTIDAEIAGSGNLAIRNKDNSGCTFVFSHMNTNYNGKLTLTQLYATNTPHLAKFVITDARNLGGVYTVSPNCFDAIEFSNNPCLSVEGDATFAELTRGFYIKYGARFDVKADKRLTLANQVTSDGVLQKTGDGMLELSGTCRFVDGKASTMPAAGSNVLHIAAGSLKISSKTAADGLSVAFDEGTKLVIPADSEKGYCNVKWQNPLVVNTEDGRLPVEIELSGDNVPAGLEVPICTFSASAAENIPVSMFKVAKLANGYVVKSIVKTPDADGNIAYVANVGTLGMQIIVR